MSNLVLYYPANPLNQSPVGGGPMTRNAMPVGVAGNLFEKLSRLDLSGGNVDIEELFVAATGDHADAYVGAHICIQDDPIDPEVSVSLMRLPGVEWSYRDDAAAHVEAYTQLGLELDWRVYTDHPEGIEILRLWGVPNSRPPSIGSVIFLSDESVGGSWEQSFVIIGILSLDTYTERDKTWQDMTIELSRGIERDVGGTSPGYYLQDVLLKVRGAQVSPNAEYHGVTSLIAPVAEGDSQLQVDSVYTRIVPAVQHETPIQAALALPRLAPVVGSGTALPLPGANQPNDGNDGIYHAGISAMPRSVLAVIEATRSGVGSLGTVTVRDDGDDGVTVVSDDLVSSEPFEDWTVSVTLDPVVITAHYPDNTYGGYISRIEVLELEPAFVGPAAPAHSDSKLITVANRGRNHVIPLLPLMAPGAFVLQWFSLGAKYTAIAAMDGTIGGDAVGTWLPGSANVTLPNLPDLGTRMVWYWASGDQWDRVDAQQVAPLRTDAQLPENGEPGTLSLSWESGGVAKSATDDGVGGIVGDAGGRHSYAGGRLGMEPAELPDGDISYSIDVGASGAKIDVSGSITVSGGRVRFTVGLGLPIAPGSASVLMPLDHRFPDGYEAPGWGNPWTAYWRDNGDGTLAAPYAGLTGTVDYGTGEYDLPEVMPNHTTALRWTGSGYVAQSVSTYYAGVAAGEVIAQHSSTGGAVTETGVLPAGGYSLVGELAATAPLLVAQQATIYRVGGSLYVPGSTAGKLDRDVDPVTGVPAVADAATVNANGKIYLLDWIGGAANSPQVIAALQAGDDWTVTTMHWLANGAPVRPGELSLFGREPGGDIKTAQSDTDGSWTGDATGTANFETGANVTTWSQPMDPASITHSGTIVATVPQDAESTGINGTQLPPTGLVPAFHVGADLLIHDEVTQLLPSPLTAGQVIQLDKDFLGSVELEDANGLQVAESVYAANLRSGVLTIAAPLDLSGYVEPLTARMVYDDTLPVAGFPGAGNIALAQPLDRVGGYSAGAKVSSILPLGVIQPRVTVFFDQKSWDMVSWSDAVSGDPAAASYNDAVYPLVLTHDGAITERWGIRVLTPDDLVEVIGERVGNLGQFSMTADIAPINPETGVPYFVLLSGGWGAGWVPGNTLRKNTAYGEHVWPIRCANIGAQDLEQDQAILWPRSEDA